MTLKNTVLAVLAVVALHFGIVTLAGAADDVKTDGLSKFDVEQIIHNYIIDNPQLIMDSVGNLQRKMGSARQSRELGNNKDILFKDATSPAVGGTDADVVIVEFMDYNCHFCKDALPAVNALLEKDKKIRIVFKDFPILGPTSETAAKWALAAQKQKKYFEYHSALMNNKTPIDDALLEKMAKELGMDVEQAKKDVAGTEIMLQIEKNRSLASTLAISGTPAFIIGDEIVPGALPVEALEQKVAAQRAKKKDQK